MLPKFAVRMVRRGNYRHKFGQRLGVYSARVRRKLAAWDRPVWIHAVSVGEVQVAVKLIEAWRWRRPSLRIVLSTTTSTGFSLASKLVSDEVEVIYHPVDFLPAVASAIKLIRPSMLVLVEAEVWPNLVAKAKACGADVALVNARLSPRSERRYLAFRRVARWLFSQLDAVCLQDPDDLRVWNEIGPPTDRLHVVGGIKYDETIAGSQPTHSLTPRRILAELGVAADGPVILGGSTHAGEEAVLGRAFIETRKHFPKAFLVVAPRHVERADEAIRDLAALGLRVVRRSQLNDSDTNKRSTDVLLIDTTGELREWYSEASIAFIGKSLQARGGQNPIEAVHAGIPFLCGPHMDNFRSLMQSLSRAEAVVTVSSEQELASAIVSLLNDPQRCQRLVASAQQALAFHRGATARTVDLLEGATRHIN